MHIGLIGSRPDPVDFTRRYLLIVVLFYFYFQLVNAMDQQRWDDTALWTVELMDAPNQQPVSEGAARAKDDRAVV